MSYKCRYCEKEFSKESTLAVHLCEQKRRWQQEKEVAVQLGLKAYLRFYEITQGSAKLKSYEDFVKSPYYNAFVKWGRHMVGIRGVNPTTFLEWLLKNNKKIDHWCKDSVYNEYLMDYLRVENVNDALARAMEFGIDWSEESGNPPEDCLRYGNSNKMAYAVNTGRISPWVIYNSESGQKFLSELDNTQVAMIWPYIDADFWMRKFKDYPADQEYAKDILQKAGW